MKSKMKFKCLASAFGASIALATSSQAIFVLAGVTDGTLSGGNPKAIILQAGADVADNTLWGVGSANNGGGTDGEEFSLPAGSSVTDDVIVIAGNSVAGDFFANNFVQNFTLYVDSAANINGDDAIELFNNGSVFDTYGDPGVDGDPPVTWNYTNGFATRTGGGPSVTFNQADWASNGGGFDGLTEQQHIDIFVAAGFTAIPEPSSSIFLAIGLGAFLRRRR